MAASATTFNMVAPSAGQQFTARDGTQYAADTNGLVSGVLLIHVRDLETAGCINAGIGFVPSAAWDQERAPVTIAAAGATQGGATAVTAARVIVTVTASTEGVKLIAVGTGAEFSIVVPGTIGVKVYPPTNCQIDALSTNTAVALVAGKGSIYMQRSATKFVTKVKGA